jgi:hypothetical protein
VAVLDYRRITCAGKTQGGGVYVGPASTETTMIAVRTANRNEVFVPIVFYPFANLALHMPVLCQTNFNNKVVNKLFTLFAFIFI